jgi:DNA-binding Lrp family transcriptional regulator
MQVIQDNPGISKRQLGDRFNRAPETVMNRISHLVEAGIVTANGDGVRIK